MAATRAAPAPHGGHMRREMPAISTVGATLVVAPPHDSMPMHTCIVRQLDRDQQEDAARTAVFANPANRPPDAAVAVGAAPMQLHPPGAPAIMGSEDLGAKGVEVTGGFFDGPPAALEKGIP